MRCKYLAISGGEHEQVFDRISVIPDRAEIHFRHQHDPCGIGHGSRNPGNRHIAVLQRLPQHLQNIPPKFRQFTKK